MIRYSTNFDYVYQRFKLQKLPFYDRRISKVLILLLLCFLYQMEGKPSIIRKILQFNPYLIHNFIIKDQYS